MRIQLDPDVDAFIAGFVASFSVNSNYASDQHDRQLLERLRTVVGDRGDEIVFSALATGLSCTGDGGGDFFLRASFIEALGKLGDRRAVPLLVELYWTTSMDTRFLRRALWRLGQGDVVMAKDDLEQRVKHLIGAKIGNPHRVRFFSQDQIVLAMQLMRRDGDFVAVEEHVPGRGKTSVIRPSQVTGA